MYTALIYRHAAPDRDRTIADALEEIGRTAAVAGRPNRRHREMDAR